MCRIVELSLVNAGLVGRRVCFHNLEDKYIVAAFMVVRRKLLHKNDQSPVQIAWSMSYAELKMNGLLSNSVSSLLPYCNLQIFIFISCLIRLHMWLSILIYFHGNKFPLVGSWNQGPSISGRYEADLHLYGFFVYDLEHPDAPYNQRNKVSSVTIWWREISSFRKFQPKFFHWGLR